MGFSKINGKLTSRIGRIVKYGAPQDVQKVGGKPIYGEIVDEVWVDERINNSATRKGRHKHDWGDYSLCGQLIKWNDGSKNIRLAYYRRRSGEDHWEYASQMTISFEPKLVKLLCEKTLGKKNWFTE